MAGDMREKYESLSLAILRDVAKNRGIKGTSTMRKEAVIDAMLEADEKAAAAERVKPRRQRPEKAFPTWNSWTADRRSLAYWKSCPMDLDLSEVTTICRATMTSMYHRRRSAALT